MFLQKVQVLKCHAQMHIYKLNQFNIKLVLKSQSI